MFQRTFTNTHRLSLETAANGGQTLTRSFTYDEAGDMKSATDNGIVTTYNTVSGVYQPDPYSLIRSKTDTLPNTSLTMTYGYDSRQRVTDVSYPDATKVHYDYNQLNQITKMPGWITDGTLNYDAAGRLGGYTLANTVVKTIGYDNLDRVNNLAYGAGSVNLKTYALSYDKAGNLATKNQNTYSYDALNQLTVANELGWFQKKPRTWPPTLHSPRLTGTTWEPP